MSRAHRFGREAGCSRAADRRQHAGAGLSRADRLTDAERTEFTALNESYKARFGPFILAVKGATKAQILVSFRERLPRDRREEFSEAIRQVCRIMTFRLEDRVEETKEQRGKGG